MARVGACIHFVLQSDDDAEKDREGSPCQEEEEVATATKVFRGREALEVHRRSTKEGNCVRSFAPAQTRDFQNILKPWFAYFLPSSLKTQTRDCCVVHRRRRTKW